MGRQKNLDFRSSGETLTREKFAQIREQIQMDKRMREKKNEKTEIQDGGEEEDPIVQSVRCLKVKPSCLKGFKEIPE